MKYLLDTHVLLWYLFEDEKLSPSATKVLKRLESDIYISAVSFWEISVKYSIGKFDLRTLSPQDLPKYCVDYGFKIISLSAEDAASFYKLPVIYHRDPFDRILIWQALQKGLIFVSNDGNMIPYQHEGLQLLW